MRSSVDLSTTVGSITLRSPVMTAAGTAGHGAELGAYFDLSAIGAVVVKSLAHFPCEGNPAIRVHRTPGGMINSVGLQGPGVSAWLEDELPALVAAKANVVASIWGRTVADYEKASSELADAPAEVIAVEVNISCPNTEAGNEMFAHSPEMTSEVLSAAQGCRRPMWAKLSPNIGPGLPAIASAAYEAGAEAVTLVNTYMGLVVDPQTGMAVLGNGGGGVSGPAIKPLAVRAVADVRAALPDLPIIGVGGIATAADVVEYARVGANAVQIGTSTFANPRTVGQVNRDLSKWCAKQNVERFTDLIGTAKL